MACNKCGRRAVWRHNGVEYCEFHGDPVEALESPVETSESEVLESEEEMVRDPSKRDPNKFNDLTETDVARWAGWRRGGKSQKWIQDNDPLCPSAYAQKKYLAEYGYNSSGYPLEEPAQEPEPKPLARAAQPADVAPGQELTQLAPMPDVDADALTTQLAAVQQLMQSLQADDVQVSGKVVVSLNIEVGIR